MTIERFQRLRKYKNVTSKLIKIRIPDAETTSSNHSYPKTTTANDDKSEVSLMQLLINVKFCLYRVTLSQRT